MRKKEEVFKAKERKKKEIPKEENRWVYYLLISCFFLLVILNFLIPYSKKPEYDVRMGFVGLCLTFLGSLLFLSFTFFAGLGFFRWLIGFVIALVLLYFGFSLLLGLHW